MLCYAIQSSATPTMPLLKVADFGLSRFGVDAQTYVVSLKLRWKLSAN